MLVDQRSLGGTELTVHDLVTVGVDAAEEDPWIGSRITQSQYWNHSEDPMEKERSTRTVELRILPTEEFPERYNALPRSGLLDPRRGVGDEEQAQKRGQSARSLHTSGGSKQDLRELKGRIGLSICVCQRCEICHAELCEISCLFMVEGGRKHLRKQRRPACSSK